MLSSSIVVEIENNYSKLVPQVWGIVAVTIVISFLCFLYYVKLKKQLLDQAPTGFVLVVQLYVKMIEDLVIEILGPKARKTVPYFIFLLTYILISNMIGIIGFENPTSSLTVTLSLALTTWIGIHFLSIKYQKLSYINHFCFCIKIKKKTIPVMINPLEVVSKFTPLISLSFRLWGNIFAGSTIITLWFFFMSWISMKVPIIGIINIFGAISVAPIHGYFDLLCGMIQALVFTLLTLIYWTLAKGENLEQPKTDKKSGVVLNKHI